MVPISLGQDKTIDFSVSSVPSLDVVPASLSMHPKRMLDIRKVMTKSKVIFLFNLNMTK
jgi:hypothetical protein